MSLTPSTEDIAALQEALKAANRRSESLAGELILVRTERDLLKERLNKFMRKIFAAKSEVGTQSQKDMFFVFNEAEVLGAQAQAAAQEDEDTNDDGVDAPAHKRARRGRKPLDPALARHVVRHELPESERVCPHDGATLREIGVEASEQLDIIPQQVRVIRHERGKSAQSKSYMWVQMAQGSGPDGTGPPIRLFAYSPSRSTAAAQILYAGMRGGTVLMTDGYAVYDQIAAANRLVHLACWAHCRRDFNYALQALPKHAREPDQLSAQFMALICKLYAVYSCGLDLNLVTEAFREQRQAL